MIRHGSFTTETFSLQRSDPYAQTPHEAFELKKSPFLCAGLPTSLAEKYWIAETDLYGLIFVLAQCPYDNCPRLIFHHVGRINTHSPWLSLDGNLLIRPISENTPDRATSLIPDWLPLPSSRYQKRHLVAQDPAIPQQFFARIVLWISADKLFFTGTAQGNNGKAKEESYPNQDLSGIHTYLLALERNELFFFGTNDTTLSPENLSSLATASLLHREELAI